MVSQETRSLIKNRFAIERELKLGIVFADVKIGNQIFNRLVVRDVRKETHEIEVLVLEGWRFPLKVYTEQ